MNQPLADKLRPQTIEDMVGQQHLLAPGTALRKIIDSGTVPNLIFYGPSGVGKTTLAEILAKQSNKYFCKLNGTTASTADIKEVIARSATLSAVNGVLLYLDEIQYFNKKQQQTLLEFIENGSITLIASTTENPYFYVYNAVLSRSTVFEFKSVTAREIEPAVQRAFRALAEGSHEEFELEDGVLRHICSGCGGDVRKAVNTAELCWLAAELTENGRFVRLETARQLTQRSAFKYDKDGDEHYDIISAYQKSMRGSDPDAAIHYLARLLEAGDLPSACRRLLVCANEDVGLAYPQLISIVQAAVDSALQLGMPEARIPLANAVILVATAPKSNSAYNAINAAMEDLKKGKSGPIPRTLQNKHFDGEDNSRKGQFYEYPHTYPNHWLKQQYLPDALKNRTYYEWGDNKNEQAARAYWSKIKGEK